MNPLIFRFGWDFTGRVCIYQPNSLIHTNQAAKTGSTQDLCEDLRWWLTIQCAARSFNSGTSNRAGLNSSSLAVGLLPGSRSRHFWMSSCKKTNTGHAFLETRKGLWESHVKPNAVRLINVLINAALIYSLLISPSAAGSPVTVWHCWWPPEKCKTTPHSHGSPEAPSAKSRPTCQRTASGEHSGHFVARCESCLQSTHAKRVDVYCRGDINI